LAVVANTSKPVPKMRDLMVESCGDMLTLRDGKPVDFHLISPDADTERMRVVGAIGEMLYEQVKKTFRADCLLVVAQNEDFKLVMFPRGDGFAIWKTDLDLQEIMSTLSSNSKDR
jgi:hypothetical protein